MLKKVRAAILKRPRQFEMDWYFQNKLSFPGKEVPAGGCGTAGCIAGWAAHLASGRKKLATTRTALGGSFQVYDEGKRVLELGDKECGKLFSDKAWPFQFKKAYCASKTAASRAKVAAKRIDHFIATEGRE